jgi:hypothetical protein
VKDRRVLALILLNGGVILASVYGSLAAIATLFADTNLVGRARGVIYMGGLLVVPLVLVLFVAGGAALIGSKERSARSRHSRNN